MTVRRLLRVVAVLLIFAGLGAPATARAVGASFGGYQGAASGSSFTAAPVLPSLLPVAAPFEGTLSLATATLSTGGMGFGRASTVWPGTLAAGLRPLLETGAGVALPIPDYPVVVEQREFEDAKHSEVPGITMATDVKPEHAKATATDGGMTVPAVVSVGSIETVSDVVLDDTTISASVVTTVTGFDLLAGIVHIDSIVTRAAAASDGTTGTCSGGVTITGASVGGTPVAIDDTGIHAQGQSVLPGVDLDAVVAQLLSTSGVEVRALSGDDSCSGASASRTTGGVLVSVPLPSVGPVPPGGNGHLIIGSGSASANATPPFDLTGGAPPSAVTATPSQVVSHAPGPASGGALSPSITSPSAAVPTAPVAAVGTKPLDYSFHGVAAQWVIGLLLFGMVGARTIRRYMRRLFVLTLGTPT